MIRLTDDQIGIKLMAVGAWDEGADEHTVAEAIAQAQLRKDYEWGEEDCLAHSNFKLLGVGLRKRRQCPVCRQAMKKEAGL